jgi:hypothetical protein
MRARLYPCGGAELPPLHAVYRRTVIAHLKRQLNGGTLRPTFLFEKHAIRVISKETLHDIDPEGLSFYNVNAPEDYQRALQRWEAITKVFGGAHRSRPLFLCLLALDLAMGNFYSPFLVGNADRRCSSQSCESGGTGRRTRLRI